MRYPFCRRDSTCFQIAARDRPNLSEMASPEVKSSPPSERNARMSSSFVWSGSGVRSAILHAWNHLSVRTCRPSVNEHTQTPGFSTGLASFPGPRREGELLELERALRHALAARFQRQLDSNDSHRRRESQLVYQRPLLVHPVSRLDADTLRKRSCRDATRRPEVGDFVVLGRGGRYDVGPRMPNLDRLFEEVAFFVAQPKTVYRQVGALVVDVVAVAAIEDLHSPLASITQKIGVVRPMIPDRQGIVFLGRSRRFARRLGARRACGGEGQTHCGYSLHGEPPVDCRLALESARPPRLGLRALSSSSAFLAAARTAG